MGKTINENEGSGEGDGEMGEDGDAYCAKGKVNLSKITSREIKIQPSGLRHL